MDIMILILFITEIFLTYAEPVYFITAPSLFRLQTSEAVSVSVVGIDNVAVGLYLQDFPGRQNQLYHRTLTVSTGEVQNTTFTVQPLDFPKSDDGAVQYVSLVAKSTDNRMSFTKETLLLLSRDSGYIFIQTDKPVYTPKQTVRIRVIPLDEFRRPSTVPIHIDVKNPQGIIVQRQNSTYNGSFITDTFQLPSRPFYGNNWTVEARFKNGLETEAVVTFEVKEYVLPKFIISIKTDPEIILPTTDSITVNISANYFHGEPVKGSCVLTYGLITDGQQKISDVDMKIQITSGFAEFILEKDTLQNRFPSFWFPDGGRLYLEVTILDEGTGRREKSSDKTVVFANHPYRISGRKSQKYFKPGLPYEFKIETYLANGKPTPNCPLILTCRKTTLRGGRIFFSRNSLQTDKNGKLIETIRTHYRDTRLVCVIKTDKTRNGFDDSLQKEVTLEVHAMQSPSHRYIKVKANLNGDRLSVQVHKARRVRATQFIHLLISSGRILSTFHSSGGNSFLQTVNGDFAPNMRIVTYTVDQTRAGRNTAVLADSTVVDVESSCHQKELEITVLQSSVSPKSELTLNVTGPSLSRVGFLAVDKAVYQISNKNRLRKEQMFSTFSEHDIGCTVGGGIDVNKVFEDAGLSVITNAGVHTARRSNVKCAITTGRKRRSIDPREQTDPCCQAGDNFAYQYIQNHLLVANDCYVEGQKVHRLTNSSNCAKVFYRCCITHESRLYSTSSQRTGPEGFYDFDRTVVMSPNEEYTFRDIDTLVEHVEIRSYFPESWMFDEDMLNNDGGLIKSVSVPDSITTHVLQAVSLSPTYGMCIAEPVEVISTKDFFIDLDLPYSVVRMEQTEIRAVLYNYKSSSLPCHVRLQETEGVCSTDKDVYSIEIEPNGVQLVRFPIVPMRAGEFVMDVIVLCVSLGDRVQKTLRVVNEGREEKKTVSFWLDPKGRRRHHHDESDLTVQVSHPFQSADTQFTTVDLTLPEEAIPGTGKCKVSAIGNIMDAAVQTVLGGVDKLLDNVPHGCGEQTMILMAPIVYAMQYLQRTNRLSQQAQRRGTFFMRVGYQRELAFRKRDGSFSVWQHRPSSTWLTAFVLKVFCQAKRYIDDIDQNVICTGMEWLFTKQNSNGSFTETSPVYHKEIMGGLNGETSLTAFVLISMLECDCRLQGTSDNIRRAVTFLERQFFSIHHPYSLAITSYALALANSNRKWRVNTKLKRYAKFKTFPRESDKGYRYWPIETSDYLNQTSVPYWYRKNPSAVSIETTAYALLTQLELDKITYSHDIVEWLVEQQQSSGAFVSTQDTIIGLQALSMYNIRTYAEDVNMRSTVRSGVNSTFNEHIHLREGEAMVEKSIHGIPARGQLHVTTRGQGVARMEVEVRYNVNDTEQQGCKFDINIFNDDVDLDILQEKQAQREQQCDVCGECEEIDIDVYMLLNHTYNVPNPDPRIGFSNQNVHPPNPIGDQSPRLPIREPIEDLMSVDLTDAVDLGRSSGRGGRGRRRRPIRRNGRSVRRRGASRQQKCVEICVSYLGNEILDMPVVDVGLPTGYIVDEEDLKKVAEVNFIDSYEISNRAITFYMEKIPYQEICFKLRMIMDFEVENLQSAKVEVYDYSKKDERCVKFYSLQYEVAELDVFCSKDNCHCVEGECAENWDNKVKGSLVTSGTVFEMTCQGYDYVLRIEVTRVRIVGNHIVVSSVIHSVVNSVPERSDLAEDSEVDFWMNLRCTGDLLMEGHFYIIYGNSGYQYIDESGTERYRYYLQGDSVIMKDYTRDQYNPDSDAHLAYWKRFFTQMESHIRTNNGC